MSDPYENRDSEPTAFNIAKHLVRLAADRPAQTAVILADRPAGRDRLSFAELEDLSNRCANGLIRLGVTRGTRTLVMVKPGFEFFAVIFALFKVGAVPVMIDPGMGVSRLVDCVRSVDLQAFIGIPIAHAFRVFRPQGFRGVEKLVTVGRRWGWGGVTLKALVQGASDSFAVAHTWAVDPAAILFTSGSTGPAKGVVYEHGMFDAQIRMIQSHYGMQAGEVDVPTFPLFALFSLAMGMTIVIPEMDASRPARADPAKIVRAIQEHQATNTFGSPALWRNVAEYCAGRSVKLPSLRRILIAGAPVPLEVIEKLHTVLSDDADVFTPFGATESLPVASISGRERIDLRKRAGAGAGTCVGRPVPEAKVRIIHISDEPIAEGSEALEIADGEVGEIVVAGPMVTREYYGLATATKLAKIQDGAAVWHRMGDVGYRDGEGRIWYCGRKSQRVVTAHGTLFTDCVEGVCNEHPDVARSALVGIGPCGGQIPVLIVEPKRGRLLFGIGRQVFVRALLDLANAASNRPSPIENRPSVRHVLLRRSLPVDVRHNAKIDREALRNWAERRLR